VTILGGVRALAQFPWFGEADGKLVLTDRSIGPVLDMHTHFALGFLKPLQVDLLEEHAYTEHYLPKANPLDLEVYVNANFSERQLSEMRKDLTLRSAGPNGMRRTHTAPNLLREMKEMGITRSVSLPIDYPFLSANTAETLLACAGHEGLIPFGSVHPASFKVKEKVEGVVHRGALGFKMHPTVQMVRPDAPGTKALYRAAGDAGVPVLWHCGPVNIEPPLGRWLSQVRWYERPIAENPRTTFVLGHAGARQPELALALQRKYPNVLLELSSQGLPWVKRFVEEADPDRIVFGSDWPFYHQGIALAKVLIATEGKPEVRHRILWKNAARMLRIEE
jgi:predicted TIM-barrel fold metal-dependent hydrolase